MCTRWSVASVVCAMRCSDIGVIALPVTAQVHVWSAMMRSKVTRPWPSILMRYEPVRGRRAVRGSTTTGGTHDAGYFRMIDRGSGAVCVRGAGAGRSRS